MNLLLRHLRATAPAQYSALTQDARRHDAGRQTVLAVPDHPLEHVCFVESGVVSIVAQTRAGGSLEVGLVGREGVLPIGAVLGASSARFAFVVQIPCVVHRIPLHAVRRQLAESGPFNRAVASYTRYAAIQFGQAALCLRYHSTSERLARWLLMAAARVDTDTLPLTHEFLAQMIGAPRSVVTEAASALRDVGAVTYQRGEIRIAEPARLHAAACECYDILGDCLADYEKQLQHPDHAPA